MYNLQLPHENSNLLMKTSNFLMVAMVMLVMVVRVDCDRADMNSENISFIYMREEVKYFFAVFFKGKAPNEMVFWTKTFFCLIRQFN